MRKILVLLFLLSASVALAIDLGPTAPLKPASPAAAPAPDPAVIRQGGDTIADAVPLSIPTVDLAGTTTGYADDYDVDCPYSGGDAPDVVYSIVPEVDMLLTIDLFGSEYDTRVWVWDETLDWPIACNDDYYPDYTSRIDEVAVSAGSIYYIVVDGYNSEHGPYLIDVIEKEPCVLDCPPGAGLEGEPPLAIDYIDDHNGGCNADQTAPPFQTIDTPVFCGVSGFYLLDGANFRDTDWFLVDIPDGGVLTITGDAEEESYIFELGPQDCQTVGVVQNEIIGDCIENTLTITGEPGSAAWIWVGPTTYASPDGSDIFEYDYTLWLNIDPVGVEQHSFTEVKSLFR